MITSLTLDIYLGSDDGRMDGEGTEELGLISSPSSPCSKVTTEQKPSELEEKKHHYLILLVSLLVT